MLDLPQNFVMPFRALCMDFILIDRIYKMRVQESRQHRNMIVQKFVQCIRKQWSHQLIFKRKSLERPRHFRSHPTMQIDFFPHKNRVTCTQQKYEENGPT